MVPKEKMYHHPGESGYWTGSDYARRKFRFLEVVPELNPTPVGIKDQHGTLVMIFSTFEGKISCPVSDIPGLKVVQGDSQIYPHEKDGELLIEIRYFIRDQLEESVRRIRPTGIMFGIKGDTDENSPGHRSLGESADYYLVGEHTIHPSSGAERAFPFWRIGVYGQSSELAREFLPEPQGGTRFLPGGTEERLQLRPRG